MWSTFWNIMAIIGIFCCVGVFCVIAAMTIGDIRDRRRRKHQMTYTKYFTEEDAENDR